MEGQSNRSSGNLRPVTAGGPRDEGAKLFEELALPVLDDLYRFACCLERNPADAADLLQEALLAGFRKFSQLDRETSFRAWMATIVRRTFLNRNRRQDSVVPLGLDSSDDRPQYGVLATPRPPAPDERLIARRLGSELRCAVDELPEEQRLAVFLIDVQGFSYAEAAEVLARPPGTVASRVARGRSRLRERLRHLARERGWVP